MINGKFKRIITSSFRGITIKGIKTSQEKWMAEDFIKLRRKAGRTKITKNVWRDFQRNKHRHVKEKCILVFFNTQETFAGMK